MHLAIQNSLALVAEIKGATALKERLAQGLDIVIVGDNDFYSQQDQVCHFTHSFLSSQCGSKQACCVFWTLTSDIRRLTAPSAQPPSDSCLSLTTPPLQPDQCYPLQCRQNWPRFIRRPYHFLLHRSPRALLRDPRLYTLPNSRYPCNN